MNEGRIRRRMIRVMRSYENWEFRESDGTGTSCLFAEASASALAVLPEVQPTHTQTSWSYLYRYHVIYTKNNYSNKTLLIL